LNRRVVMNVKKNGGNIDTEEYLADQFDAVRHEISAFIESIAKGTGPIVKGEDGLKALALADQIKRYIAESKR
jgi:predicted dehydrogenase